MRFVNFLKLKVAEERVLLLIVEYFSHSIAEVSVYKVIFVILANSINLMIFEVAFVCRPPHYTRYKAFNFKV